MLAFYGCKDMAEMFTIPTTINSKGGLAFGDWMRFMGVVPKWNVVIDDVSYSVACSACAVSAWLLNASIPTFCTPCR